MIWRFATETPPLTSGVSLLPSGERLWRSSDLLLLYFWEEGSGGRFATGIYCEPEDEPGRFEVMGNPADPDLWADFEYPDLTCRVCGEPMPSLDLAVLLRLGWKMNGEGGWICEEDQ